MTQGLEKEFSGSKLNVWSASFGEVDAILSSLYEVKSAKRTAFQARLKHFLKLGALPNVKLGRGKAATYRAGDLITLAVLCDLSKSGINPERAIYLVQFDETSLVSAVSNNLNLLEISHSDFLNNVDEHIVMFFIPDYLTSNLNGDGKQTNILLWGYYGGFVEEILSMSGSGAWRQLVFSNFSCLLREILIEVEAQGGKPARLAFLRGISAWITDEREKDPDRWATRWGAA